MNNFFNELKWRGVIHSVIPGTEGLLESQKVSAYIGFDPTADSLHVGSLAQIINLLRFQKAGHNPICLIGGATGMVGDPSGKSAERNLLDEKSLLSNISGISEQLSRLLPNVKIVNNLDWMKDYPFINFIRDIGKYLSVNYMMSKDSVQSRMENGISFTEFSYQLLQAYDFYYLYNTHNCLMQMGGSDQWGNITSGTELIHKKCGGKGYGLTTELLKKADGTKFGKSEGGNIWLDKNKTSVYKFYQFWLNTSDQDVINFLKIFTFLTKEEIDALIVASEKQTGLLQKILAKEVTIFVHGEEEYLNAIKASEILFKGNIDDLSALENDLFLDILNGLPQLKIENLNLNILDFLVQTKVFPSKGDARKMILAGGFSINKTKIKDITLDLNDSFLIKDKYLLAQKGKKDYYLCSL